MAAACHSRPPVGQRECRNGLKADITTVTLRRMVRGPSIICLIAGVLAGAPSSASGRLSSSSAALMEKNLVRIGAGRKLNMVCVGQGSPTIIFETGLGSNLLHWQKVIGPVSKLTRACFYDRAGYGYSDPSKHPSTAANAVQDLHALLLRSGVQRPVVLVGHSLGGLYVTLYADTFPSDVAGLVLIEPSFAAQDKDEDAAQRAKDQVEFSNNTSQLRTCAALATSGELASKPHEECFAFAPDRTAQEKTFLRYQMVRPYRYEAMASEAESQHSANGRSDVNSREEAAAQRSFGDIPLIVLTAAESRDSQTTQAERSASECLWRSWKAGHDALAARSTRGKSLVVAGTGHFVQLDQPQAVINAIKEVVRDVQTDSAHR